MYQLCDGPCVFRLMPTVNCRLPIPLHRTKSRSDRVLKVVQVGMQHHPPWSLSRVCRPLLLSLSIEECIHVQSKLLSASPTTTPRFPASHLMPHHNIHNPSSLQARFSLEPRLECGSRVSPRGVGVYPLTGLRFMRHAAGPHKAPCWSA